MRPIELYLLSQMRHGQHLVAEVLQRSNVTLEEMKHAARLLVANHGIGEPAHRADVYRTLIGDPVEETGVEAVGAFAGSITSRYELDLWPDVHLCINEDREGWAWGWRFENRILDLRANPDEIRPWKWTSSAIRANAMRHIVIDAWSTDEDLEFQFPRGRYRGLFDWGLLQDWQPVKS